MFNSSQAAPANVAAGRDLRVGRDRQMDAATRLALVGGEGNGVQDKNLLLAGASRRKDNIFTEFAVLAEFQDGGLAATVMFHCPSRLSF